MQHNRNKLLDDSAHLYLEYCAGGIIILIFFYTRRKKLKIAQ